jgi:hypothetical protein
MADNNSANDDMNNGKDGDKNGGYSNGLLRLVEETDKNGGICYCVECVATGDLLYSSNSKPQAFSFCEGYRARDDNEGAGKTHKPKADGDNSSPDNKAKPTQSVDPAKVQRKRAVI